MFRFVFKPLRKLSSAHARGGIASARKWIQTSSQSHETNFWLQIKYKSSFLMSLNVTLRDVSQQHSTFSHFLFPEFCCRVLIKTSYLTDPSFWSTNQSIHRISDQSTMQGRGPDSHTSGGPRLWTSLLAVCFAICLVIPAGKSRAR